MALDVGTVLADRYDLLALLGEGGSARVFRARDQVVDREVAVKVMHEHVPDSDRSRFLREVRTLARLNHPGVVPVLDLGVDPGTGRPFFTMPLMTGGPVTGLGPLEDAPGPLARFLTAAAFASRALHFVHAQGITHRDLTPGNVLLDSTGLPCIMDFGLVALSEHTRHLTRSGVTLGTPAYMAPEQARGIGVGPLSDLYALGAVLYRVVCGSPPFVGDSDQSVLYQHVYEKVPDPRDVNPAVPDAIARVLLALLAKKPEQRPETGEALAHLWALARRDVWTMHARSQYRGGRTRTGEHPDGPARAGQLQEVWSVPLPGEVTWPAAVMGEADLVTVGTRGGQLVLTHASGRPFATYAARDEVTAPPTFQGGHVLFGAWDGTLRRVELHSGAEQWRYQARAELTGAPTLWNGRVLAASRDGHLHALNAHTGELLWAYRADGPVAASPLVWAGAALVCDENGWLHALDARTGAPLWKVQVGTVHGTPALLPTAPGEAALVIATWEGEVHALALTASGGRAALRGPEPTLWTYDLEDEVWASPALSAQPGETGGVAVLAGWGGTVRALRLADGEDLWARTLRGRVTASPVISAGQVFLASEEGELTALDVRTGAVRWAHQERHGVQATPLAADGTLYVAFMNGTLRAYRDVVPGHAGEGSTSS
ncbi:DNA damage-responsive serine/threonine-protein kinase RqkA [Deinococcus malanensis]|uniref:DNA damage-responsive serine/threonine-protein kinase RqkA n=1 Tax=Deinococcus malanensis TaxID=1706855 RepID=A0ABQ2EUC5_9DEIO|nr:serine/threonine-protein kinase [Deinococcus malanensis]GGK22142.1 DNA damage-responsive serine/threonine-protein kinase RqkA [Deinococcus malanensis]